MWEAMSGEREFAAKFIGLILWEVLYGRDEDWYFHKVDKTIVNEHDLIEEIQVVEYFRTETFDALQR